MSAMCPERAPSGTPFGRLQAGFTMLTAIFLLVILAVLGAALVSVSGQQQMGSAMDLLGARAYQAAKAGVEWGAFQSLRNNSCSAVPTSLTFAGTTLADFTTVVTCARSTADESGATVTIDQIIATACNQAPCPSPAPGANYIERQLTIVVGR